MMIALRHHRFIIYLFAIDLKERRITMTIVTEKHSIKPAKESLAD